MMSSELRVNASLFSDNGVIGRCDYLLKTIYLNIILSFFALPMNFWIFTNMSQLSDGLSIGSLALSAPIYIHVFYIIGCCIGFVGAVSLAKRRMTDILGYDSNRAKFVIYFVVAYSLLSIYLNFAWLLLVVVLNLIFSSILIFKKGKITSKLPYDVTKYFNIAALFGTFLWGLYNKAYKTLWIIPLLLTPYSMHFAMICALKGNKWALKAKKVDDVEKFKYSQKNQAIFFIILFIFLSSVLPIFAMIGISALAIKSNPQQVEKRMDAVMQNVYSAHFTSSKITKNENKFYMLEKEWARMTFSQKTDVLDFAAAYSAKIKNDAKEKKIEENEKKYDALIAQTKDEEKVAYLTKKKFEERLELVKVYYSKTTELPRTKIYSKEKNQLLAEFVMPASVKEGSMEFIKAAMNAYKFYRVSK